jgi:hypothetical protein
MQFLEQIGSILGLDEVSKELGFDLQTDAVIARAEQLSKLEGDRLADKVGGVQGAIVVVSIPDFHFYSEINLEVKIRKSRDWESRF